MFDAVGEQVPQAVERELVFDCQVLVVPANGGGLGELGWDRAVAGGVDERAAVSAGFVGGSALGGAGVVDDAASATHRLPLRLAAEGPEIDHLLGEALWVARAVGNHDGRQADV